jgi:hypothetical protein
MFITVRGIAVTTGAIVLKITPTLPIGATTLAILIIQEQVRVQMQVSLQELL